MASCLRASRESFGSFMPTKNDGVVVNPLLTFICRAYRYLCYRSRSILEVGARSIARDKLRFTSLSTFIGQHWTLSDPLDLARSDQASFPDGKVLHGRLLLGGDEAFAAIGVRLDDRLHRESFFGPIYLKLFHAFPFS